MLYYFPNKLIYKSCIHTFTPVCVCVCKVMKKCMKSLLFLKHSGPCLFLIFACISQRFEYMYKTEIFHLAFLHNSSGDNQKTTVRLQILKKLDGWQVGCGIEAACLLRFSTKPKESNENIPISISVDVCAPAQIYLGLPAMFSISMRMNIF